jgi:hypothetical protein
MTTGNAMMALKSKENSIYDEYSDKYSSVGATYKAIWE